MNSVKRIMCALLILPLIITAFAGCENNDEQQNTSDTEQTLTVETTNKNSGKTVLYITGAVSVAFSAEGMQNYEPTSFLTPGTEVELEQSDLSTEYVYVYNPQEKVNGFVQSIYLVRDKSSVTNGETLIIGSINSEMFSNEGGKGTVLKVLLQGEEVSVLAKASGGYWKVKSTDNVVGYVNVNNLDNMVDNDDTENTVGTDLSKNESKAGTDLSKNESNLSGKSNSYMTEYTITNGNDGSSATGTHKDDTTISSEPNKSELNNSSNTFSANVNDNSNVSSNLQTYVSNAQSTVGGNWAAALVIPENGEKTFVNDSQMQAASLIKLYIMGAIYEKYDTYIAQEPNLDNYLQLMITISDNDAANNLVRVLGSGNTDAGKSVVTAYCKTHGYNYSSMGRLLLESTINGDNYTSVGDCVKFLTAVYNSELPHSGDMLSLLKQQTRTSKIPAGVPKGVQTANKTGELDTVQNDAAIIFADTPYILCVMSENVPSGSAISAIVTLSSEVYSEVNE